MKKIYSKQQKTELVKLYSSGNTVTELSNQYGIARSTIYSWLNDSKNKKLLNRKINMRDVFDLKQKKQGKALQNTYYFLPITSYFPKNPECNLGKSEEVRGNK